MVIWTIANQKGGVGKTTTVISLAGLLAQRGFKVLLIDTDPHASLTSYLQYASDELPITLYDLFLSPATNATDFKKVILPTEFTNISLIPGSMSLATLDKELGEKEGMGLFLKRQLTLVKEEFDFILIDCPPVLGVLMVNALAVCETILVPVQTEFLATNGLNCMIKTLKIMQQSRATDFDYCIIPTMYDKRTKASLQTLKNLKETYQENIWDGIVPIDTKFRDASLKHIPISMFAPKSRGALAYDALLNFLLEIENN